MVRKPQILFGIGGILTDGILVFVLVHLLAAPPSILTSLLITLLSLGVIGLFRVYSVTNRPDIGSRMLYTATAVLLGLGAAAVFSPFAPSTAQALITILATSVATAVFDLLLQQLKTNLYQSGTGTIPTLILGMGPAGERFLSRLQHSENTAQMNVIGFLDNHRREPVGTVPHLGKLVELERVLNEHHPEIVIQIGHNEQFNTVAAYCERHNVEHYVVPSLFGSFGHNVAVNTTVGIPLISIKETNLQGWGFMTKRLFDITGSSFLILALSPVWLSILAALAVERRGTGMFANETRIDGRTMKPFTLYRFATLKDGRQEQPLTADELQLASNYVVLDKNLEHTTRLGRFLRKTELNELPQLINVLNNTMSLVGPRPAYKEEIDHYTNLHKRRLRLKPGITGLWQIEKEQTSGTHDALLKKDIAYVETWTPWLDAYLVLKTGQHVLTRLFRA